MSSTVSQWWEKDFTVLLNRGSYISFFFFLILKEFLVLLTLNPVGSTDCSNSPKKVVYLSILYLLCILVVLYVLYV